jgi:hypothetical protein
MPVGQDGCQPKEMKAEMKTSQERLKAEMKSRQVLMKEK